MKLLSIEYIPGVEFEALGIVKGTVVQTKNVGKDFMKSAKNSNAASPTVQSLKSLQLKHPVSVSPVLLHSTLMYL